MDLLWGKRCLNIFSIVFDQIFFKLAGNEDMHTVWDKLNFGQIGPLPTELGAIKRLNISHRLIMGKWCLQASLLIFDRNFVKRAGN